MKWNPEHGSGSTGGGTRRAARHQPEQRLNRSIEVGICRAAVAVCIAGIAITVWVSSIGLVLGGAA